jgi:23S rRNA pseudouridine1911/1915/1917 synthase
MKRKKDTIENILGRDKKDRKKVAVINNPEEGKTAITNYEVISEFDFLSLLKVTLKTGRTHQIRVTLASTGHPVFGDETYGGRIPHSVSITNITKSRINNLLEVMKRQALHARVIGFVHPQTKMKMRFESELPDDMKEVIKKISQ